MAGIRFILAALAIGAGAWAAFEIWDRSNIALVLAQAEELAGGRPYCLQIVNDRLTPKYRAVETCRDLSLRKMHAERQGFFESPLGFHGVLVIEAAHGFEWMNWSYRNRSFMKIEQDLTQDWTRRLSEPVCIRRADFGQSLPD